MFIHSSILIIPSQCQTRLAEYLHKHLEAILADIPVLLEALQSLFIHPKLGDKSKSIMKFITDIEFIAKIQIINSLYENVSKLEKEAQGENFGALQYINLIERLNDVCICCV